MTLDELRALPGGTLLAWRWRQGSPPSFVTISERYGFTADDLSVGVLESAEEVVWWAHPGDLRLPTAHELLTLDD